MSQFLTVKEAAKRTGKSTSSIRRVIYPIIENDQHPDRPHVQPSPDEVMTLRMKGETFAWRLSDELLQRAVPVDTTPESEPSASASQAPGDAASELLAMLRRELDIKNQQITQQSAMLSQQMELISGLSERLREGNVLIGSLQQQLALPEVSSRPKSSVVDGDTSKPATAQAASKSVPKSPKAAKPKRGFFGRMFR